MSLIALVAASGAPSNIPGVLGLRMPRNWGVIAGQTYEIWWQGLGFLLAAELSDYTFEASGPGSYNSSRWTWTPTSGDVGTHTLVIRAYQAGVLVGRARCTLHVFAATGHSGTFRIVMGPGDSITAAAGTGAWRHKCLELLEATGLSVTDYGSVETSGVKHDGYSGRTFQWHEEGTIDDPPGGPWAADGAAHLAAYGGGAPGYDVCAVQLGTNDWPAQRGPIPGPDHPEDFAVVIADAEQLVAKIRSVTGAVLVGPTFNSGDGTIASYGNAQFESDRRIGVGLMFDAFEGREAEGYLMGAPTHACLDPDVDFDSGDGIHPLTSGHTKIGTMIAGQMLYARSLG